MAERKGQPIGRRAVTRRVSVLTVLVGVFYALDWMPLRVAQRDVIGWWLRAAGYAPEAFVHDGSPAVRVGDHVYFYTAECTYLDLLIMVMPFVWVFGASRRSNILRIAITAVVILSGNLVRCSAALYLDVLGVDMFYAHDLPDYIVWWPTVAVVVLLALRRDFGDRSGSRRMDPIVASAGLRTGDVCA